MKPQDMNFYCKNKCQKYRISKNQKQFQNKRKIELSNFNSNWMEFKEFKNSFKNKHTQLKLKK